MDQILFVFDLECIDLRLCEENIDCQLTVIRQAALQIGAFCSDALRLSERRRDLPSFGFRFE